MVLLDWFRRRWLGVVVHTAAPAPLALLLWQSVRGTFLVDPVREITTRTGSTALILLMLSLACTPLAAITGWRQVASARRALGLYAALYAGLHFLTFVGLDYGFDPGLLREAILDQRFVLAGVAAGILLLPLALTSTRRWQRRLGKNWKRLHRLAYPAAAAAVVHFLWLSKDPREPLRFAAILAALFLLRLPWVRAGASRIRRRIGQAVQGPRRSPAQGE